VLAIIDACHSGHVAEAVVALLDASRPTPPVCFITSAYELGLTSAYVISEDLQLGLPTITEPPEAGGATFGVRQGHSMFTRALMVPVVYGVNDVRLDLLVDQLNGDPELDPGFHGEFRMTQTVPAIPSLRDLVPQALDPSDQVRGLTSVFSEVICADEVGMLYDDMPNFLNLTNLRKTDQSSGYVVISGENGGLSDHSPISPCVIGMGFFCAPTPGLAKRVDDLGVIKDRGVEDVGAYLAAPKGPYVPLQHIHWDLRAESFREGSGIEYNESAYNSMDQWGRVDRAFRQIQPTRAADVATITFIACYVSHLGDEAMVAELRAARKRTAKKLGIELEGEEEHAVPGECGPEGEESDGAGETDVLE
jgi:hypothetical protein